MNSISLDPEITTSAQETLALPAIGPENLESPTYRSPGRSIAVLIGTDIFRRWTRDIDDWLLRQIKRDS